MQPAPPSVPTGTPSLPHQALAPDPRAYPHPTPGGAAREQTDDAESEPEVDAQVELRAQALFAVIARVQTARIPPHLSELVGNLAMAAFHSGQDPSDAEELVVGSHMQRPDGVSYHKVVTAARKAMGELGCSLRVAWGIAIANVMHADTAPPLSEQTPRLQWNPTVALVRDSEAAAGSPYARTYGSALYSADDAVRPAHSTHT